jgi:hypothetical protein
LAWHLVQIVAKKKTSWKPPIFCKRLPVYFASRIRFFSQETENACKKKKTVTKFSLLQAPLVRRLQYTKNDEALGENIVTQFCKRFYKRIYDQKIIVAMVLQQSLQNVSAIKFVDFCNNSL